MRRSGLRTAQIPSALAEAAKLWKSLVAISFELLSFACILRKGTTNLYWPGRRDHPICCPEVPRPDAGEADAKIGVGIEDASRRRLIDGNRSYS